MPRPTNPAAAGPAAMGLPGPARAFGIRPAQPCERNPCRLPMACVLVAAALASIGCRPNVPLIPFVRSDPFIRHDTAPAEAAGHGSNASALADDRQASVETSRTLASAATRRDR
ncbi:MAG: hypothetical protein KatS3mg103_0576 [Phycisphaerales bacterium]|nr:MAG: hypothetical protein KatS3mg103_0576 [Phycisphaerales bacterium]